MKKVFIYILLFTVIAISLILNVYLYIELDDSRSYNSTLREQRDLLTAQIDARNSVIDRILGTNIVDPLTLSDNYEQIKQKYTRQRGGFNVITVDMEREIVLPLYTPDGHYFGEISYAAYRAITRDELKQYECVNDEELQILHSYMNYITLNPGLSLIDPTFINN